MKIEKFIEKITYPHRFKPLRLLKSMWRQKSKTPICPGQPRLDGKLALVTGGNNGIGFETTKGLAQRGADVIILARNEAKSKEAIKKIGGELGSRVHFISMDLADLGSIFKATSEIARRFPGRKVDLVVANAGVSPEVYSKSSQGYEKSFAINVLGHHVLLKASLNQSLLQDKAHVIGVTGDIYILENDCTPNFTYKNDGGGMKAYCRSKLGVIWWARELLQKHPNLSVNLVHPGVVATNFGGESHGSVRRFFRKAVMLSPEAGAQTTLICATQPGIRNGGYYHNTMGQIILSSNDPGSDSKKSREFWNLLESISKDYVNKNKVQ